MDGVSHVETDELSDRYGSARPVRRRLVIVASGVLGVVALAWVVWAAWFQSHPDVQSSLRSFHVADTHSASAVVIVKPRSRIVSASCLVRAYGADHSVVGELNFKVTRQSGTVPLRVTLRTEREATSVELVGCTTPGQSRPR